MGFSTPVQRHPKVISFYEESPTQDVEINSQYDSPSSSQHDNFQCDVAWRWSSPKTDAEISERRQQRILKQRATNRLLREFQMENKKLKRSRLMLRCSDENKPKTGFFLFQEDLKLLEKQHLEETKSGEEAAHVQNDLIMSTVEGTTKDKRMVEVVTTNLSVPDSVASNQCIDLQELLDDSDFDRVVCNSKIDELIQNVEQSVKEDETAVVEDSVVKKTDKKTRFSKIIEEADLKESSDECSFDMILSCIPLDAIMSQATKKQTAITEPAPNESLSSSFLRHQSLPSSCQIVFRSTHLEFPPKGYVGVRKQYSPPSSAASKCMEAGLATSTHSNGIRRNYSSDFVWSSQSSKFLFF